MPKGINKVGTNIGWIKKGQKLSEERKKHISESLKGHLPWTKKHGMDGTSVYKAWVSLKARCYNKNDKDYKRYGGRGITVCKEWKNSFERFYKDMGDKPSGKHSIDRINVNGNYCKSNCRWATIHAQNNNKTCNHRIIFNGEDKTITEWSRKLGIPVSTMINRITRGYTIEKTLEKIDNRFKN